MKQILILTFTFLTLVVTNLDTEFTTGAVTIGHVISGPPGFRPDWRDHLFVHEYGHYIQSQRYGPGYFSLVGLPSLTDVIAFPGLHDTRWYEAEASRLGSNYFDRYNGSGATGYVVGDVGFFDRNSFISGSASSYNNSRTGRTNRNVNPINPIFHWSDPIISGMYGGLLGGIFSILKF